jgi:hypothetical protein
VERNLEKRNTYPACLFFPGGGVSLNCIYLHKKLTDILD